MLALADAVLDDEAVSLALEVQADGERAVRRAIELAALVLSSGAGATRSATNAWSTGTGPRVRRLAQHARDTTRCCAWHHRRVPGAAAANPRSQCLWRKNPGGAVRTLDDALAVGRRNGVVVDDFLWTVDAKHRFAPGEFATYAQPRRFTDASVIRRTQIVTRGEERYRVRLNERIMDSDDAILAVLAHEVHEIRGLDAAFGAADELSGREWLALVDTTVGTLHCEAWEVADRLVLPFIETNRWP